MRLYLSSATLPTFVGALVSTVLACAASCSRSDKPPQAPDYSDMRWNDAEGASAETRQSRFSSMAAGDRFVWRGSMFGIEIGRLAMAVGHPGTVEGRDVVVVTSQFESTAAAAIFAPVKSVLTTFVDTATVEPAYHRREVEKGTIFQWVEVTFTDGEFVIDYRRRSDDADSKDTQKRSEGVPLLDINSLLLAARTWELAPGERIAVDVFREIYTWTMQIQRAQESEIIDTPMGEFPAVRYDVVGRSLERDASLDPDEAPRQYSFWLTDDARRLPIQVIAKTDYGDLRMKLVQYEKLPAP